jgi:hypothetical protein
MAWELVCRLLYVYGTAREINLKRKFQQSLYVYGTAREINLKRKFQQSYIKKPRHHARGRRNRGAPPSGPARPWRRRTWPEGGNDHARPQGAWPSTLASWLLLAAAAARPQPLQTETREEGAVRSASHCLCVADRLHGWRTRHSSVDRRAVAGHYASFHEGRASCRLWAAWRRTGQRSCAVRRRCCRRVQEHGTRTGQAELCRSASLPTRTRATEGYSLSRDGFGLHGPVCRSAFSTMPSFGYDAAHSSHVPITTYSLLILPSRFHPWRHTDGGEARRPMAAAHQAALKEGAVLAAPLPATKATW